MRLLTYCACACPCLHLNPIYMLISLLMAFHPACVESNFCFPPQNLELDDISYWMHISGNLLQEHDITYQVDPSSDSLFQNTEI
jgi:hypothetical protein